MEITPSEELDCCQYTRLNMQHSQRSVVTTETQCHWQQHMWHGDYVQHFEVGKLLSQDMSSTLAGSTQQDEYCIDGSSTLPHQRAAYSQMPRNIKPSGGYTSVMLLRLSWVPFVIVHSSGCLNFLLHVPASFSKLFMRTIDPDTVWAWRNCKTVSGSTLHSLRSGI